MNACPICTNPATGRESLHAWAHLQLEVVSRYQVEVLELRLQVADGPRTRVKELERIVELLNRKIAELNGGRR